MGSPFGDDPHGPRTSQWGGIHASSANALDIGHDWVVNGFAEITSDDMHTIWERTA